MVVAKPDKRCYVCGEIDWWWNGQNWTCGRCHPCPSPDTYKEPYYDKPEPAAAPIVGSSPTRQEVIIISKDPEESKLILEVTEMPLEDLRARVIHGNDKLIAYFTEVMKDAKTLDGAAFDQFIENLRQAVTKLQKIEHVLEIRGYHDCLYIENGVKTRSCLKEKKDGVVCWICPSRTRYWDEELFGSVPQRRPPKQVSGEVIEWCKTMGGNL
jgi:hypothetical protein